MACVTMMWPSIKLVMLVFLAGALILSTSTANGITCETISCEGVDSPACRFCNRRVGKRTENYAWLNDRDSSNLNSRGQTTTECYLDTVVNSLPHKLQEQVLMIVQEALKWNQ